MKRRLVLVLCLGFLAVSAHPVDDNETSPSQEENTVSGKDEITLVDKLNSRCSKREASACLMLKLVTYVNRLIKKADIPITESLQVTQVSEVASETLGFAGAREAKTDEEAVGDLVAERIYAFVRSRALRWNVVDGADLVLSATPEKDGSLGFDLALREQPKETGRGKMKNMGPLIAAGAMKMGMVGILAFKALALLVGKALLISKLAFLLAAIIGLKKLFSQQKHVTYEVVAHPHHAHHEHHGAGGGGGGSGGDSYSSGWGRSIEVAPKSASIGSDPHTLAYKAHAQ